jgi:hypothetical protein
MKKLLVVALMVGSLNAMAIVTVTNGKVAQIASERFVPLAANTFNANSISGISNLRFDSGKVYGVVGSQIVYYAAAFDKVSGKWNAFGSANIVTRVEAQKFYSADIINRVFGIISAQ